MEGATKSASRIQIKKVSLFVGGLTIFALGFLFGQQNVSASLHGVVFGSTSADLTPFWQVWNYIDSKSPDAKNISDEERVFGAIKGLVGSLGDPYSTFFDPEENKMFQEEIDGAFGGIGIELGIKDGFLYVVSPLKNSPAEKAGIMAGDSILEVDGVNTAELTMEETIARMRGEKGTEVTLTVVHENETAAKKITITRDIIKVPSLEYKKLENNIFMISIHSFAGSIDSDFKDAIAEYKKSKSTKLILDVRGNPGGYLESAISISSYFIPLGTPVVIESYGDIAPESIHRSKGFKDITMPKGLIVLVDGGSASASEIVAGALSEEAGALIVGEQTFGKGSVQELIPITESTSLKITIAHWLTPKHNSIDKAGITPTYSIIRTSEDVKNDKDPALEKAIDLLNKNIHK